MNKKYTPFIVTSISFATTLWMFFKLQLDYSYLEIINSINNIVNIQTPTKMMINIFNMFSYEYIIGLIVLFLCSLTLLFDLIDRYYEEKNKK